MQINQFIVWVGLLLLVSSVAAQSLPPNVADDCGSGFTGPLVPDRFLGCEFQKACRAHDVCYGACDSDGEKHGTPYCSLSEYSPERRAAKRRCDARFFQDMVADNKDKSHCEKLAALYAGVVKVVGQGPFNARMTSVSMDKIINSSQTPDEAVEKTKLLFSLAGQKGVDLERLQLQGSKLLVPLPKRVENDFSSTMIAIEKGTSASQIRQIQRELGVDTKK